MRIAPELDHKIRREIRDARVRDPLVSVVALQEQIEKQFNRTFSRKYIAKLAFKVERRALEEADRTKIEERIQFTRENYRMARERLLKILYWKPEDGDKQPANRDDFRVEMWDRHALHIRWVIAASGSVYLAHAAFDEAVKQYPDQRLTLRNGIMVMREHPDPRSKPR
jgi:hypothetical protein